MKPWPIAEVLPHAGDMILLDDIERIEAERIVCLRTIRPHERFVDTADGLPAWAGVELMAQAIAAWAGCHARSEQRPVRLGFLLGTRRYESNVDTFPTGTCLRVEAVRSFHDEQGMGVFQCRIDAPGLCVQARLNVFSPPNPEAFLQQASEETPHE